MYAVILRAWNWNNDSDGDINSEFNVSDLSGTVRWITFTSNSLLSVSGVDSNTRFSTEVYLVHRGCCDGVRILLRNMSDSKHPLFSGVVSNTIFMERPANTDNPTRTTLVYTSTTGQSNKPNYLGAVIEVFWGGLGQTPSSDYTNENSEWRSNDYGIGHVMVMITYENSANGMFQNGSPDPIFWIYNEDQIQSGRTTRRIITAPPPATYSNETTLDTLTLNTIDDVDDIDSGEFTFLAGGVVVEKLNYFELIEQGLFTDVAIESLFNTWD